MTNSDKIILELICKALDGSYQVDSMLFKDLNWADVIEVATTQGVLGICFDAIEQLDASCRPDMDNLMDWLGQVSYMERSYEWHQKAIEGLAHFYEGQSIKMMLLKGYGLSLYWPKPNHRPVGDIDIYLGLFWQYGDQMVHEKLGIEVESGHEHHTTFSYRGIVVENHYDFINVKAHKDAQYIEDKLKELASSGSKKVKIGIEGKESEILLPSADFNAIFLIRHLGQHFAGEYVTLRQLLDWGLFFQHSCDIEDTESSDCVHWNYIVPFLKEMGIWTFFNQINAVCEDYLGIKLPYGVSSIERKPDLEKRIIEDILHPEFNEKKPQKLLPVLWFKTKRWWYNRWKHPLVYNEWLLPMFLTLLWSHLRKVKTIKD